MESQVFEVQWVQAVLLLTDEGSHMWVNKEGLEQLRVAPGDK